MTIISTTFWIGFAVAAPIFTIAGFLLCAMIALNPCEDYEIETDEYNPQVDIGINH